MTTFAEFYHLKDPRRTSFLLSPEHDSEILVDSEGEINTFLARKLSAGTPTFAVLGDFGTGKSHVLRHVEKQLASKFKLQPVYVRLSGFGKNSTFGDLHVRVMTCLEPLFVPLLAQIPALQEWLEPLSEISPDARVVVRKLAEPGLSAEQQAPYRAWLLGTGPTPRQAIKLGLAGLLFTSAGPTELVRLWKLASEVVFQVRGRRLLLLLDEGESFQAVQPDVQQAIGAALRELFDADNRSLGFVVGLNLPSARSTSHPLLRSDVASRMYGNELRILPLAHSQQAERFLHALWQHLAPDAPPLLTSEGLNYVTVNLRELRGQVAADVRELAATPTPRDLLKVLDLLGQRAFHQGLRPPLGEAEVRRSLGGRD